MQHSKNLYLSELNEKIFFKHFKKNLPDFAFLFAWNHKNGIIKKERYFNKIGKWIAHVKL